jgi:hypothetical protein
VAVGECGVVDNVGSSSRPIQSYVGYGP